MGKEYEYADLQITSLNQNPVRYSGFFLSDNTENNTRVQEEIQGRSRNSILTHYAKQGWRLKSYHFVGYDENSSIEDIILERKKR